MAGGSLPATLDGSAGLTRSGRVQLHSDCAVAKPLKVHGFEHYWLRGRLRQPLAPGAVAVAPEIDRLGLRTVIDRPVSFDGTTCAGGLVPEQAFAEGAKLDLTKTAYVLGRQAGADSALYLACEEAFSRPGAQVTVCLKRSTTPEDSADAQLANYELGVEAARQIVENVRKLAQELIDTVDGLIANELAPTFESLIDDAKIAEVQSRCNAALAAMRDAAGPGQTSSGAAFALALNVNPVLIVPPPAAIATVAAAVLAVTSAQIVYDIAVGLRNLSSGAPANLTKEVDDLRDALAGVRTNFNKAANGDVGAAVSVLGAIPGILATWAAVAAHLTSWPATSFADATLPGVVADAKAVYERLKQRVNGARTKLQTIVKPKLEALRATLADLSPVTVAAAAGVEAPKLDDPRLAWEYWDGVRWRTLVAPSAADPNNLLASGTFGFTVPVDWEPVVANEVEARWLRARLVSGAFARIRTVSWQDQGTKEIKYMAIVEPRPPAVDALRIGYRWESAPAAPQRCLTLNDFQWADRDRRGGRARHRLRPVHRDGGPHARAVPGFRRPAAGRPDRRPARHRGGTRRRGGAAARVAALGRRGLAADRRRGRDRRTWRSPASRMRCGPAWRRRPLRVVVEAEGNARAPARCPRRDALRRRRPRVAAGRRQRPARHRGGRLRRDDHARRPAGPRRRPGDARARRARALRHAAHVAARPHAG